MTSLTRNTRSTIAAVGFAVLGLFFAVSSVSIVAAMLGAGVGGEAALAAKVVDAIIAGSTVATIVSLLAGGGLGAGVIAGIKWAIKTYGREKAIS
ncbi:MAG: uberolysin/carnocyclin family circular bacteriocin [Rothia sp. (in: high G+C Gram-positive bacteria)]|uniref:uberolysin/carnocyclin family circular bacteriocin n=1 Tax=Rothia sp. (in: high G+C Gram-positive bacteria) TaxID=1885016 RepID=UPI0026DD7661|nr:uberolysin/carnocyclin family circular bacteriocin [Rothia sp. (in: high G+C Gram-positive bacteria)]MDO4883357.1 uberolysin/carnocyclin family circular bacteriocin [Rothia sp. (in: high G+C Gram-positive bacteria)]